MRICALRIRDFRTIESLDLPFPFYYAAISGRNDSGKTNLLRAIQALMHEEEPPFVREEEDISIKDDFPKWKDTDAKTREISVAIDLSVNKDTDAGLYQFLVTYLSLPNDLDDISLTVQSVYAHDDTLNKLTVIAAGREFDGLKAQDVLNKLRTSRAVLFHSSTDPDRRIIFHAGASGMVREMSPEFGAKLDEMKKIVDKGFKKIARGQQDRLTALLGRLEQKYTVGLSVSTMDFAYLPFTITLADRKVSVNLDDWGSGTRNRTLILLTLFRAREISKASASASKITPVVIIEEPESFLHPSAQAQFGRILQDVADEFQVQVIATTHSPYMLSQKRPESNILLERRVIRNQQRETVRVDCSKGDWMIPFGEALGVDNKEFEPWREALFGNSRAMVLVEGDIDREYFELLRQGAHGTNRLEFEGDVFAYGGRDVLKNTALLRFIKNRFESLFITFDLDALEELRRTLDSLGLKQGQNYMPVGLNSPGKMSIEGLLPDRVRTAVYGANPDLVQQATNGTSGQKRDATQRLKRLYLEEFKARAVPGDDYKHFYQVARTITKALRQTSI